MQAGRILYPRHILNIDSKKRNSMKTILDQAEVLIPLVTPFDATGNLERNVLKTLLDWLVETGRCDGVILTGTNGEFWALDDVEKLDCYRIAVQQWKGKVPIIAATGCTATRETIHLTKEAEHLGVDMAMVIVPPYGKPEPEGIYRHFAAVAEAVTIPLMIYNIPTFTGTNIDVETVARLAQYDHIIAIKDEAGVHATQTADFIQATGGRMKVYNGDDKHILQALAEGAFGLVSGGAHVIGKELKQVVKDFKAGRLAEAQTNYRRFIPFLKSLHQSGRANPVPLLKASLEIIGLPVGPPRLPFYPATEEERKVLRERMPAKA
jgi:4-hydroxy-tetrahydrodipicolinate synthase